MAEPLLTVDATIQCAHGGSASITPGQSRVKIGGSAVALQSDTTTVSGCSFQIPIVVGTKPQPCTQVRWVTAALRIRVAGQPVLLASSQNLAQSAEQIPQGTASVSKNQSRVRGT